MAKYLEQLTIRLAAGAAQLPGAVRSRHADFLTQSQRSDGGFTDREGNSDLYYTGFALRSLSILGQLYGPVAERAATFLRNEMASRNSIVDYMSHVYGAALLDMSAGIDVLGDCSPTWREDVVDTLEQLRREDGGYAKSKEGGAGSTYYSFLALMCHELIGKPVPHPERLIDFVLAQCCEEGGFREIRVAKRPSTNPTAAAIGVLRSLDALDNEIRDGTISFLAEMQTDEGGLRANTRIPIADLLSTFTGLLTLADLDAMENVDTQAASRYVERLQQGQGGFLGGAWDEAVDVEYTFYGLGCLSLLS